MPAAILKIERRNFSEFRKIQNYVDESPYSVNLWSTNLCEQSLIVINKKLNVAESRKPAKSKVSKDCKPQGFFLNRNLNHNLYGRKYYLTPSYNFVNLF